MEPAKLIKELTIRGFQKVAIIGGAEIYRIFIDSGEVDKIYMTVEPIKFGKGIPFYSGDLKKRFRLVDKYKLDTGTEFRTYERTA